MLRKYQLNGDNLIVSYWNPQKKSEALFYITINVATRDMSVLHFRQIGDMAFLDELRKLFALLSVPDWRKRVIK